MVSARRKAGRAVAVAMSIGLAMGCSSSSRMTSARDDGGDARTDATNGADAAATDVGIGAAEDAGSDARTADARTTDAERPGLCAPVDLVGGVGRNYAGVAADGSGVKWIYPGVAVPGPLLKYDPSRGMNASEFWSWSQADGTFTVRAPGTNGTGEAVYTYWPYAWRNVAARATLRVDSGTGGGLAIWYGGGVAYYFAIYPAEKKVRLIKLGYLARTVLAEADADIAVGEMRQVELTASGCTLTGRVPGLVTVTATADPGRSGPVGLFADLGGVVTFDSIDVSCIDGAACLPPPP